MGKGRLSDLHMSQMANQVGAYPSFSSTKQLGVFLLPPAWNADSLQGYPQHYIDQYPFVHLGGESHCGSKVSCPRTQHNVPGQDLKLDRLLQSQAH